MRKMKLLGAVAATGLALLACQSKKNEDSTPSAKRAQGERNTGKTAQARPQARPRPVEVRPARVAESQAKSAWTMNFDQAKPGTLPADMDARTGKWTIAEDDQAKSGKGVIAQLASNEDSIFNVVLLKGKNYKDLRISVWIKAMQGKVDQGGGPVWRAKDEKNYYVARYNPLEDNLRLYYVKDGRRKMLTGTSLRVDHKAWHKMTVTMVADHITVSLDGKKWLDFHDRTFTEAGMVGLWTKSDARTHFDDLSVAFVAPVTAGLDAGAKTDSASAHAGTSSGTRPSARESAAGRKPAAIRKPAPSRRPAGRK